jgi:hypothetical protein
MIKLYKGESLNIVFSAYDKNGATIDLNGYEKEVTLFTPFSSKVVKNVLPVSNYSFKAFISSEDTAGIEKEGKLSLVLTLKKGTEVKIGKVVPCRLIDPGSGGCEDSSLLSVDEGTVKVDMNMDTIAANFDMYFGNALYLISGTEADEYIKEAIDKLSRIFDGGRADTKYGGARHIDCGKAND